MYTYIQYIIFSVCPEDGARMYLRSFAVWYRWFQAAPPDRCCFYLCVCGCHGNWLVTVGRSPLL